MSGGRRAFIAAAAGLALVGYLASRRVPRGRPVPAQPAEGVGSEIPPTVTPSPAPLVPTFAPSPDPSTANATDGPLTPSGAARALQAIGKSSQTRMLFARLQTLGLSREQQQRVILILGAAALRPPPEGQALQRLREDGRSRALSPDEGKRVLDEQKRVADHGLRDLRPALASVLTPAQLTQAGLSDDAKTAAPAMPTARSGAGP